MKKPKYIFVTGGVASSLGKGVSIASIGTLLEAHGYKITIQKLDPYINVDPGTMSPHQHGEVYVTKDGAETDLDLGYYERFTSSNLTCENSVTTGQIYNNVIQCERRGEYLGATVQVIPHITNEIKKKIMIFEQKDPLLDFILVEIGGTVGDIESIPFLEAIRQMRLNMGQKRTLYIHLTLIPKIYVSGEVKTKPTQHSVKELLQLGIQPDILICRAVDPLSNKMKDKISLFCNIPPKRVISAIDLTHTIYEVPILYHKEGLDAEILEHFDLKDKLRMLSDEWNPLLQKWQKIVKIMKYPVQELKIAIVGKYILVSDAYRSIYESLQHGGIANKTKINFIKLNPDEMGIEEVKQQLSEAHGILVPGGFGERGIEGKINAIQYSRENKIPFLGICLGMQCAVIEFARNVLKLKNVNSIEFDENALNPVIIKMKEQVAVTMKGGTMRLGNYKCRIKEGTLLRKAYQKNQVEERHRHRFEFNNQYKEQFEDAGMQICGISPNGLLVEAIELNKDQHPWFIATQFHPEFCSTPLDPHKLFTNFIAQSLELKNFSSINASSIN